MIHPDRRPFPVPSRRGFLTRTLGVGLGLGAAESLLPRVGLMPQSSPSTRP